MNRIIKEDALKIAAADIDWAKLAGKTVLISGANGYVPQYFVHGMLARNDRYDSRIRVVALCRSRQRAYERFAEYFGREDFILLEGDVRKPVLYDGTVDYVIHAASPADIRTRSDNCIETFDTNVMGCKNLLELADQKRAEFLLLSSVDIYGEPIAGRRLTEDYSGPLDLLSLRNTYACAKRASETMCMGYVQKGNICKIVRPFQILAGGIRMGDGRLHADFIRQMLEGDEIVLKGDGKPVRSFLYITDAVTGMLTVMLSGGNGEAYNIVSEKGEASVYELAHLMAGLAEGRNIRISYNMETRRHDPAVTQAVSVVCGDAGKLRKLGWEAEVPLDVACRRMMEYYGL